MASSRRGRPLKLSHEQQRQIITFVEAGGSVDAAARAAGIATRTLRELKQRAYGHHPTRSQLPNLKPFFEDLHQAIGRQLLKNEIWLSEHEPKFSLNYLRARLDAEGEDPEPIRLPTAREMQQELEVLIASEAFRIPPCSDEHCPCRWHRGEGGDHDRDDP